MVLKTLRLLLVALACAIGGTTGVLACSGPGGLKYISNGCEYYCDGNPGTVCKIDECYDPLANWYYCANPIVCWAGTCYTSPCDCY
jgi:hypothetical protein